MNNTDYVTESYNNGTNWYQVWRSGRIQQGGLLSDGRGALTITLLKKFPNTTYIALGLRRENAYYGTDILKDCAISNKTTTNFKVADVRDGDGGGLWIAFN